MLVGSWFFHDTAPPDDLSPGDLALDNNLLAKTTAIYLANGCAAEGDPSGLFLRMINHPGIVKLQGAKPTSWAFYEWPAGGIIDNGRSFTFQSLVFKDRQGRQFTAGERIYVHMTFWPIVQEARL